MASSFEAAMQPTQLFQSIRELSRDGSWGRGRLDHSDLGRVVASH